MNGFHLALGLVLLVSSTVDLLWTTLWVEGGAGPLTSRLMAGAWRALRRLGGRNARALGLAGPLIFVFTLITWIALLWSGWTLVFVSAESALTDTLNRGSISWSDHLYFAGYTMFTLGNGDFVPREGIWQFVTVLATGSGMLLVTLTVSYTLSVLDAITQKRSFASGVTGLGTHGNALVRTAWDGEGFSGLDLPLNAYVSQLNTLTSNHKAYPVLHYFYSPRAERAPVVAITILDEALTIFRFGISEEHRPNNVIITNARSSVQSYLETLHSAFIHPADEVPPPPNLDPLSESGLPTVSDEEFTTALETLTDRRRTLLGLINSDARRWPAGEIPAEETENEWL
ncbi:potassium channel family protein [Halalkalicoccus sp. NIPERK01]|uniref:potassium channel family protein n=1 Tax=Halalkalicoccus sp. NIPERK01 TaxID=3053469 RepID=UPI00256F5CB8|nr:potassium channel family protein [Halalkalicoccus sp. NIPERK01]MDL5361967.1 potassium channel family protein [Halalkalicoccus sp. NIPERK01]